MFLLPAFVATIVSEKEKRLFQVREAAAPRRITRHGTCASLTPSRLRLR